MGGSASNDHVFNVYNYLDGSSYDYNQYYYGTFYNLGYTPESNGGGVSTSDIETISGFGGMNVALLSGGSGGVYINSSTGQVVTGTEVVVGETRLLYYDPTTGQPGYRVSGEYSGLYGVGAVGTATPFLGGS